MISRLSGARPWMPALLAGLLLAACTQDPEAPGPTDPGPTDPDPAPGLASLEIIGEARAAVGTFPQDSRVLKAVVLDSAGDTVRNVQVTWALDVDTSRAEVFPSIPAQEGGSAGSTAEVRPKRAGAFRVAAAMGALRDTVTFEAWLPGVGFVFADTAPEAERRLIRDAVQDAQAFHRLAFDRPLDDSVTISGVYSAGGCSAGGAAAFAGGREITFCLGNPGWKTHGPGIRQKIVHHEFFHLWQFARWSEDPAKSPAWLVEGAAELMAFYGIAHRKLVTLDVALGCQRKESADFATNRPPGLPSLQSVEGRQAFQTTQGPLYTHSMLGAHFLVESGNGLAALEMYGNLVRTTLTWQAAFEAAFKKSPTAFYGEFPGYVSGLEVPSTYQCRF